MPYEIIYMETLKYGTHEVIYRTEMSPGHKENGRERQWNLGFVDVKYYI